MKIYKYMSFYQIISNHLYIKKNSIKFCNNIIYINYNIYIINETFDEEKSSLKY